MLHLKPFLIKSFGGLIPAIIPPLHIYVLYRYWGRYARRVDKRYCSCSCWDTVFKGTYESGIASYKHLYFNATANTTKIWLMTVLGILLLYESCKYELKLLFEKRLRFLMLTLFLSSLFSHYYTWWVYINYWNDDFYLQWNHQLFFTITEVMSTIVVLHLSDAKNQISPKKVFTVVSIALVHILAGGLDQFVTNVVWGEGYAHQVLRDICFMIPDVLHVVLPLIELAKYRKQNDFLLSGSTSLRKDVTFIIILVTIGFSISYVL